MEHFYNAYLKDINGEPFFFVKHFLVLNEVDNITPLLVGYGMHREYEKACNIANIKESDLQKKIRLQHLTSLPGRLISIKDYKISNRKKSG